MRPPCVLRRAWGEVARRAAASARATSSLYPKETLKPSTGPVADMDSLDARRTEDWGSRGRHTPLG